MEPLANDLIKDYRQTQWKEFLKRQGSNPLSSATFWKRVNRLRACLRKRVVKVFTYQEPTNAIKNMNSKTSVDPIGKFKKNGPVTKERMLSLFNDCLREHKVPKEWKHSVISMLLKPDQSAS